MDGQRTKYEALLDVRYHARLNELHIRFYGRFRMLLAFVSLVSSSAAFFLVFANLPGVVVAAGLLVAMSGFIDVLGNLGDKRLAHVSQRRQWYDLLSRSASMTLEEIDQALSASSGDKFDEIEALRLVAYNDNLRSNGFENLVRTESRVERLMRAIA